MARGILLALLFSGCRCVFCQSRRLAAYHEQGQAPAPRVAQAWLAWHRQPENGVCLIVFRLPFCLELGVGITDASRRSGINARPTAEINFLPPTFHATAANCQSSQSFSVYLATSRRRSIPMPPEIVQRQRQPEISSPQQKTVWHNTKRFFRLPVALSD